MNFPNFDENIIIIQKKGIYVYLLKSTDVEIERKLLPENP